MSVCGRLEKNKEVFGCQVKGKERKHGEEGGNKAEEELVVRVGEER